MCFGVQKRKALQRRQRSHDAKHMTIRQSGGPSLPYSRLCTIRDLVPICALAEGPLKKSLQANMTATKQSLQIGIRHDAAAEGL